MVQYIVSACLCGIACRYDGGSTPIRTLSDLVASGKALAICPEMIGGLGTPREPCEIWQGRVRNRHGEELTPAFLSGAQGALTLAKMCGAKKAVLKERSPSCGVHTIYDGSFSSRLVPGCGITTRLLQKNGIAVISDEDFLRELDVY